MNEEILKLAKACFGEPRLMAIGSLEAFYRAAFNQGLEAGAKVVEGSSLPDTYSEPCLLEIADEIRALKQEKS